MHSMIRSDASKEVQNELYKVIDFVQPHKETLVPEIKKELPPEPKPKEEPPKSTVQSVSEEASPIESEPLNIEMPNLLSGGMQLSKGAPKLLQPIKVAKMDSVLTPMVQIKPLYPSRAKRMGIEGYVKVQLEVDETGLVNSIEILESSPEGVFDKSTKRAVKKWKFRPKTVDGRAVSQTGTLTIKFNLGKE
jgi:protein TonB